MTDKKSHNLVSVHGGHSGEFCNHAADALQDIIKEYIRKGFYWVGITEHMPPLSNGFLYEDEKEKGLDAKKIYNRFKHFMATAKKLQVKYRSSIEIFVGFETETYTGYSHYVTKLIDEFKPDYIVGSVHHVNDLEIDTSKEQYNRAIQFSGDLDTLYCDYFDQQYEMIRTIKPQVVGHFDLVRIGDPDYPSRLIKPVIWEKITRNLDTIKQLNIILDYNVRALYKGAVEPYISSPILQKALELNISVVPGDDSHGLDTVGRYIDEGMAILKKIGFNTNWKKPVG